MSGSTVRDLPVIDRGPSLRAAHRTAAILAPRWLALRLVKRCLDVRQASMAPSTVLSSMGLSPGTVNPFADALAGLVHISDVSLLKRSWVSTNASVRDKYVVFHPCLIDAAGHNRWVDVTSC